MAVQNKSKGILNINCPENCNNKVYINPNFNRLQVNNYPSSATMHVNPKFSHLVSNGQGSISNKNKIYINPNFIKPKSVGDGNQCIPTSLNKHSVSNIRSSGSTSLTTYQPQSVYKEATPIPAPVAQSRYCLVRENVTNKSLNETAVEKATTTFKLNKYKTVSWKHIKRNLNNVKSISNNNLTSFGTDFQTSMNDKGSNSLALKRKHNEFKLINYNNTSLKEDKTKTKIYTDIHKKINKSNQANQSRLKKMKGNLKKNNIPCPLFRKFGKCLRNERGKCEFLHDKKHVSICRKFIKGLCHDRDCLLSHDLTTKKMPTCYFYLQGTCTKPQCPYLHVKLNEKTKICPDFAKGYCEKGSKCLQRHINSSGNNKAISQIRGSFRKKYNASKISQSNKKTENLQATQVLQTIENINCDSAGPFLTKAENCSENRYYDEHRDYGTINESYETIKPMRCKLGTLPSFIQL